MGKLTESIEVTGGGANVKSDFEIGLQKNQGHAISFTTPFSSVPDVTVTCGKDNPTSKPPTVYDVTVNGFTLEPDEGDDFHWIATDAGNS